jgi:2-aminobenzoylacetyl-CoA thioesterase
MVIIKTSSSGTDINMKSKDFMTGFHKEHMNKYYISPEDFPVQLEKNIFMLGNYFFNVFLIIGKKKTAIFETGVSATVDTIISQIERLNIYPDFIIPAHPHSDHITGLPGLMIKYPDAKIIIAEGAKEFIEHPKAGALLIKEDAFISKNLLKNNIHPGRVSLQKPPEIKESVIVRDRESIDLGDITLNLIKIEGHSPGGLIAHVPELKTVFTSDSLGFHFPGRFFFPLFFTGLNEYISSIELIKSLNPLILCPAHQGSIEGDSVKQALKASLNATHEIVDMIKYNKDSEGTLVEKLFNYSYIDEFTLYTESNILNCIKLLIKRVKG